MASQNPLYDIPLGIWIFLAAVVLACGIGASAFFPRYQSQIINDGRSMMIYDRWSGRFQRADFSPEGEPMLKGVGKPF